MERPPTTEEQRTARLEASSRHRFQGSADRTAALDAAEHAPVGRARVVLDRYRLERRLGAGGFGVVWLAFDEKLEREVAIKVMERDPGDEPVPERAAREARVAARLNHPGIVSLYELGEDSDAVYLVSELVHGRTMGDLVRAGAVSDRDVARIGAALCDALAHAHERKVVHRDVKPQNVLVAANPAVGAGFAKLADFGVAHLAPADPLTRTGDVVGTLAYMAPEQAEGARVTSAADVYSLALTLYEAWAGANPVRGATPAATARRLGRPLPSLAAYRPDLPRDMCAWIDAALDVMPERRPPLAKLREALGAAAPALADSGGLVEPETLVRVGIDPTTTGRHERARPRALPSGRAWDLTTRAAAGAAAGGLLLAGLETLGPQPRFSTGAAALAAALIVAALPRLGWLAVATAFVAWLGFELRDGTALVVGIALLAVPILLPRAGRLWSLAVLAPLLGVVALGPAFVALAGMASTAARRAGLAAAGFAWLAFAELLTSNRLLFGPPVDAAPRAAWARSLGSAGRDAVLPLIGSPVVVGALAWAILAALLPYLVSGRSMTLDVAGALVWGAALVAALAGVANLAGHHIGSADPRGALLGALFAAFAAVGARAAGLWHNRREPAPVP